jgi:hypothetical protein
MTGIIAFYTALQNPTYNDNYDRPFYGFYSSLSSEKIDSNLYRSHSNL